MLRSTAHAGVAALRVRQRQNVPAFSQQLMLHTTSRKEEEALPPTFVEKYDLTNPVKWVPAAVTGFGIATATGLYHWDEESQLLGLFALLCGTIYAKGGPAIGNYFDETADAILKEHQALEATQIEATKLAMEAHQAQTGVFTDIKEIFEAQSALMDDMVVAASAKLKHEVRNDFVKKLDTIVRMEEDAITSTRTTLIEKASEHVRDSYTSGDASLKKDALASALAAIEDPTNAGVDKVGDLYKSFFADFGANLEASRHTEQELSAETIQEMSEAMESVARRDGLSDFVETPKPTLSIGNL